MALIHCSVVTLGTYTAESSSPFAPVACSRDGFPSEDEVLRRHRVINKQTDSLTALNSGLRNSPELLLRGGNLETCCEALSEGRAPPSSKVEKGLIYLK